MTAGGSIPSSSELVALLPPLGPDGLRNSTLGGNFTGGRGLRPLPGLEIRKQHPKVVGRGGRKGRASTPSLLRVPPLAMQWPGQGCHWPVSLPAVLQLPLLLRSLGGRAVRHVVRLIR